MLGNYDFEKLKNARDIIMDIYNYNYGTDRKLVNRLETILNKIDYIIDETEKKRKNK